METKYNEMVKELGMAMSCFVKVLGYCFLGVLVISILAYLIYLIWF